LFSIIVVFVTVLGVKTILLLRSDLAFYSIEYSINLEHWRGTFEYSTRTSELWKRWISL